MSRQLAMQTRGARPWVRATMAAVAWLWCLVSFAPPLAAATLVVDQRLASASDDGPGTAEKPFATIGRAVKQAKAGDSVLIRSGLYREAVVLPVSGTIDRPITVQADIGAEVVVTGADPIAGWRREPGAANIFSAPWPHRLNGGTTHPSDAYHAVIGRVEQVIVNNYLAHQVLEVGQMSRGSFCIDAVAGRLLVQSSGDEPVDRQTVEASLRDVLWDVRGDYITTRGLHFRYACNRAQLGMAVFQGAHALVEACLFEQSNGCGAQFRGTDITVRGCRFENNGQLGYGGTGAHRLHIDGCTISGNNAKDFARGWEAGGDKLCLCRGVVIEKSRFIANHGVGIWFDIGNEDCSVSQCLIADNEDAGIFYEISLGLHAHDNVVIGNGLLSGAGAWGARAGICLSSSPGCAIERNLLIGNREGFDFREQDRTTPRIDHPAEEWIWNHDEIIRGNLLAYNLDAQVWGWFDIGDGRHWPQAMQARMSEGGAAATDQAAAYLAKSRAGAPAGLSLERLKIAFTGNCYLQQPGHDLFNWGVPWKHMLRFSDLAQLHRDLALEDGQSTVVADCPVSLGTLDFRLPKDHPALAIGAYPQGPVPGCIMGAR